MVSLNSARHRHIYIRSRNLQSHNQFGECAAALQASTTSRDTKSHVHTFAVMLYNLYKSNTGGFTHYILVHYVFSLHRYIYALIAIRFPRQMRVGGVVLWVAPPTRQIVSMFFVL